jgi:hypothetical protein
VEAAREAGLARNTSVGQKKAAPEGAAISRRS